MILAPVAQKGSILARLGDLALAGYRSTPWPGRGRRLSGSRRPRSRSPTSLGPLAFHRLTLNDRHHLLLRRLAGFEDARDGGPGEVAQEIPIVGLLQRRPRAGDHRPVWRHDRPARATARDSGDHPAVRTAARRDPRRGPPAAGRPTPKLPDPLEVVDRIWLRLGELDALSAELRGLLAKPGDRRASGRFAPVRRDPMTWVVVETKWPRHGESRSLGALLTRLVCRAQ